MHLGSRVRAVAALVALAAVLAACSSGPSEPAKPTASGENLATVRQLLAGSPSDLMKSVLADLWVDDAELSAARDDFRACLVGKRPEVDVAFPEAGGYDIGPVPTDPEAGKVFDADVAECGERNLDPLESLYNATRTNPEGLTWEHAIRRCFEEHDVPDGADVPDGEFRVFLYGADNITIHEPESEIGKACMMNPYDIDDGLALVRDPNFAWPS